MSLNENIEISWESKSLRSTYGKITFSGKLFELDRKCCSIVAAFSFMHNLIGIV
jgi:hypothetical protein